MNVKGILAGCNVYDVMSDELPLQPVVLHDCPDGVREYGTLSCDGVPECPNGAVCQAGSHPPTSAADCLKAETQGKMLAKVHCFANY